MALEEADRILLASLADVDFYAEDESSIGSLTTEEVYAAALACIRAIVPAESGSFPSRLPSALASKMNACAVMASLCKKLGFKADIGYHSFLYGSVSEVRKILCFLAHKLPQKHIRKPLDSVQRVMSEWAQLLNSELQCAWLPGYCRRPPQNPSISTTTNNNNNAFSYPHALHRLACLQVADSFDSTISSEQCAELAAAAGQLWRSADKYGAVSPPLETIATHTLSSADDDRWASHAVDAATSLTDQEHAAKNNLTVTDSASLSSSACSVDGDEIGGVGGGSGAPVHDTTQAALTKKRRRLERGRGRLNQLQSKFHEVCQRHLSATSELDEIRRAVSVDHNAIHLLTSGGATDTLTRAHERSARKQHEWRLQRQQMKQKLAGLQQVALRSPVVALQTEHARLLQILGVRRRQLTELQQQLGEIGSDRRETKRASYMKRIVEINSSVLRQRAVVMSTVQEISGVRHCVNNTNAKLDRAFNTAENVVFQDVTESEWARAVYRALVQLQEHSASVVQLVQQTAAVIARGHHLQHAIEIEGGSGDSLAQSHERVARDLAAITAQNHKLQQQLAQ